MFVIKLYLYFKTSFFINNQHFLNCNVSLDFKTNQTCIKKLNLIKNLDKVKKID